MKIFMTTDNLGGVWTYSIELAKGLQKKGVEVFLAVIGEPLSTDQEKELQGIPHDLFVAKQEWMEEPWEDVNDAVNWLFNRKQLENPDIMHFNSYTPAALNWQIPTIVVLHSCVLTWWEAVKNEAAPEKWQLYRENISRGIQSADVVLAPSGTMLRAAEKYYGPFSDKGVIYNGRNSKTFQAKRKEKFVFSMGRIWDEAKNINLIVEAASQINYPVYIAGDYETGMLNDLPSNVYMLGKLDQEKIANWLSFASIYLLPAKYEPFGYTFLEAAFSGCALIGSDIDSLHEIWGDAMLYVSPHNAKQLANSINQLMEDDEKLLEMQNKAEKHARVNYKANRMTDSYFSLYKNMIKKMVKLQH